MWRTWHHKTLMKSTQTIGACQVGKHFKTSDSAEYVANSIFSVCLFQCIYITLDGRNIQIYNTVLLPTPLPEIETSRCLIQR